MGATSAASAICAETSDFWPTGHWRNNDQTRASFVYDDIERISAEAIAWGRAQDISAVLAKLRALPTSSPGTSPVQHLAALAIAGEVTQIESYQRSFAAGDRLGFVPYITADYIDRALAQAREHVAAK